jgi:CheY-like chemotaxis protein
MPAACSREVLVVDDDFEIRDVLSQLLEEEGYRVQSAANGQEAIGRLRAGATPCVILLDLMMPVMNGWQFRSEQAADPALAQIPVVVISASRNIDEKALALDAADLLHKPLELDHLLDVVSRYCK